EKELVETRAKESLTQVNTLLTETMIRLEKSNAIKSDFLATVSHELRTPMNGIIASNELLKIADLPEETKEYVQICENSSKQMMELIDSMLQFVDIQSGQANLKKELIDIDCLFAEVGDSIRVDYADKKIKFMPNLPSKFKADLYTDYQKLLQIIEELVDNAFKFTTAGEVCLGVRLLGDGSLADIEFFVIDTGIGIEEEHLSKIFDAFYLVDSTSKRKYGGIGMGLTTAQSLANILGGNISVESTYGEGSEFKLKLPLYSLKT
ncbi:MAG: HAMP domain-containing histidine kinase, partial [Kangiellaceae bacterium]|nr:HAMP domain-containing histidine kinase [Kangiellaceae bacterium]